MKPARTFPPEHVIFRLLQRIRENGGKPITRTHLVKLVYLADYMYARHTGRTMTGFEYMWDNYGPNAVGNQIVKRADQLDQTGAIQIVETLTSMGNSKFLYRASEGASTPGLDSLADRIIDEAAQAYGTLDWKDVVAISKRTEPMRKAKQGDLLDLSPNQDLLQEVGVLSEQIAKEPPRRGQLVSLRDLKARYGAG